MDESRQDDLRAAGAPGGAQPDHDPVDGEYVDVTAADGTEQIGQPTVRPANRKRRRGSRGGRNRKRPAAVGGAPNAEDDDDSDDDDDDDD